jgi:hypothetical protein
MKNPRLSPEQINGLFDIAIAHSASHNAKVTKSYLAHGECDRMTLFVTIRFASRPGFLGRSFQRTYVWDHACGFAEVHGLIDGYDDPAIVDAITIVPARIGGAH